MKKYLCGVDVGGTKLSAGLFHPDGNIVDSRIIFDHKSQDCDGITDCIINLIKELLDANAITDEELYGIGIGIAGHINNKKGLIITSSNFKSGFNNFPLRERVARKFRTHVILDNDANAQAYGEYKFGAGKNFSDIVFFTVSTGVGCGIIINKQLVRGMSGTAGEIGHTIIDPNSEIQCSCGNYGCIMSLSSGQYLPALYRRYLKKGIKSSIGLTEESVDTLDGEMLKNGISTGDEICANVLRDSANAIGTGLYNLFQILNPEIFIIGGGLVNVGDQYIELIEQKYLSLVKNMMYDKIEIRPSALGKNAGLTGAAALTLE